MEVSNSVNSRQQAWSTLPSTFTTHSLPMRALLLSAGHVGAPGMQPSASPSTVQDKQPQREEKIHASEHRYLLQIMWLPESRGETKRTGKDLPKGTRSRPQQSALSPGLRRFEISSPLPQTVVWPWAHQSLSPCGHSPGSPQGCSRRPWQPSSLPASLRAAPGTAGSQQSQVKAQGLLAEPPLPLPADPLLKPEQCVPLHFPTSSRQGRAACILGRQLCPPACSQLRAGEEHPLPLLRPALLQIQHPAPSLENERNSKAPACHRFNRHSKRKFINPGRFSK